MDNPADRYAAGRPTVHTIGGLIDAGEPVIAVCGGCGFRKTADLEAMAAKLGRDFSLWNYRCACPTPGCANFRGWIRFMVSHGMRVTILVNKHLQSVWLWEDPRRT